MSPPRHWFPVMLNWELDMLECALRENADRVHKFIVTEATLTHQGRPKPLHWTSSCRPVGARSGLAARMRVSGAMAMRLDKSSLPRRIGSSKGWLFGLFMNISREV